MRYFAALILLALLITVPAAADVGAQTPLAPKVGTTLAPYKTMEEYFFDAAGKKSLAREFRYLRDDEQHYVIIEHWVFGERVLSVWGPEEGTEEVAYLEKDGRTYPAALDRLEVIPIFERGLLISYRYGIKRTKDSQEYVVNRVINRRK